MWRREVERLSWKWPREEERRATKGRLKRTRAAENSAAQRREGSKGIFKAHRKKEFLRSAFKKTRTNKHDRPETAPRKPPRLPVLTSPRASATDPSVMSDKGIEKK